MSEVIAKDLDGVIYRIMWVSDSLVNSWHETGYKDEKTLMRCLSFLMLQAAKGLKLLGDKPENERELLANLVAVLQELDVEMDMQRKENEA